jgi:regulator of protease activity HflC (stomatin/prohibitin superfamily)
METEAVVVVAVVLLVPVTVAVVASCVRTVPHGTAELTSRYGRDTGVKSPGRHLRLPIIDSSKSVSGAPFSRAVTYRSATSDALDVGATMRVHFSPIDLGVFGRFREAFDDQHEGIIRRAIAGVLASRTHDDVLDHPGRFAGEVHNALAPHFGILGLGVVEVVTEELFASRTGAPTRRVVGAVPPRVPGPVEVLELARRERDAILNPPTPPTPLRRALSLALPFDHDDDEASDLGRRSAA